VRKPGKHNIRQYFSQIFKTVVIIDEI